MDKTESKSFHHPEIESAIIGTLLLDENTIKNVSSQIKPEYFLLYETREIYKIILDLYENEKPIDRGTIEYTLKSKKMFDSFKKKQLYEKFINAVSKISNIDSYCKTLKDNWIKHSAYQAGIKLQEESSKEDLNTAKVLVDAEARLNSLALNQFNDDFKDPKEVVDKTLKKIDERCLNKGKLSGIPTGFGLLDFYTEGLQKTDLIYLAARPSMGKTALALNIVSNAVFKENKKVAFFSLEMSDVQLTERMFSSNTLVELSKIKKGEITDDEKKLIMDFSKRREFNNLFINDLDGSDIDEVRFKSKNIKNKYGLDMIAIDYLQLMVCDRKENRQQEISTISRKLKKLAKELECPILCLSQLSRAVENRIDHQPILSDLRESGSIEQDADVVAFLYRKNYYDNESPPNIADIIIAKNRNGEIGNFQLGWKPEYTLFTNATV